MQIGIDRLGMYSPHFFVDLKDLAEARGVDPNKFIIGIGQSEQAVAPSSEDVVTMGANAAAEFIDDIDTSKVGLVILGTETGIDASKSGAVIIQRLLGLPEWVRTYEIKQACYGGTAGLMTARDYVAAHPDKTALVIAADIARYGLNSGGEVTQGAGAVAMLISANPAIMTINDDSVFMSRDIMDFWRPVYTDLALAKGKYSTEQYIKFFDDVWARYQQQTGLTLDDFAAVNFHLPYTKMGLKAFWTALPEVSEDKQTALLDAYQESTVYSRRIGNIYTGSLYLGLVSLLENDGHVQAGDRLGMFSYGSGAVGEFFSGELQEGFARFLHADAHREYLDSRQRLSVAEYERVFNNKVPYSADDYSADPQYLSGRYVLTGVENQERQYEERPE
ncbi:3-hydroxy-3-methylglutaryl CoA synthase [Lacticaseibacillus pantheris DSM 15945 = JCM 12539 = NBRC 106106]|uniref:3-hydroxy-3-methylglutaryl CoA synthase n=1 Tax=Lacticaseibacillus pantheris DSM 15945 = JCM 12539 = NBRC 106106 TaxID=1423783 RepID=A0A0R1U5C5_9LACO|nr:hydroxymethylglutaryl-CoA synthase [Lacticaseibacillus pantheris]KRL86472.1 3-hydroxy-3-methylglutaryl CoA synthase [Lacticaseibacillus pantheris DSM 15945 = JCM 12539 = NBRC 106106]